MVKFSTKHQFCHRGLDKGFYFVILKLLISLPSFRFGETTAVLI